MTSISKPTTSSLNQSLAIILSVGEKTPLSAEQITSGKRVNEQECYAALIHSALSSTNPKVAKRFEQELAKAAENYKSNHGGELNMFKVSDRLMRQYVREKVVSQDQYRTLRDHSFGNAQLDSDRTKLSAERIEGSKEDDTPLRAVSTFYTKLESNQSATSSEIAQFRAHEAAISAQKFQERKSNGASGTTPGTDSATSETLTIKDLPKGFLWKPSSDSDGRLVVLLPPQLTSMVHSLSIKDSKGVKVIEDGRYSGIGNGGRLHFRFSKSGSSFPDGAIVEIKLTNGSTAKIPISETSARIES